MHIYPRYKIAFIRIPKTAGSSMLGALANHEAHEPELSCLNGYSLDMSSYLRFTFVRNPWDRAFSYHCYSLGWGDPKDLSKESFNDFVKSDLTKVNKGSFFEIMTRPQVSFIMDKDGKPWTNFVGKYESLEEDWDRVIKHLREAGTECPVDSFKLKKSNASKHRAGGNYKDFYDQQSIDIVGEKYKEDINYFNYNY